MYPASWRVFGSAIHIFSILNSHQESFFVLLLLVPISFTYSHYDFAFLLSIPVFLPGDEALGF